MTVQALYLDSQILDNPLHDTQIIHHLNESDEEDNRGKLYEI